MPVHDQSLALRRAIVARLRENVGAVEGRVYEYIPDANVSRPYIRYGEPLIAPFEAVGIDANETEVTIHVFASGPGTDSAYQILSAVVSALDDAQIPASGADIVWSLWIGTTIVPDEASQFVHGVARFKVGIVTT